MILKKVLFVTFSSTKAFIFLTSLPLSLPKKQLMKSIQNLFIWINFVTIIIYLHKSVMSWVYWCMKEIVLNSLLARCFITLKERLSFVYAWKLLVSKALSASGCKKHFAVFFPLLKTLTVMAEAVKWQKRGFLSWP